MDEALTTKLQQLIDRQEINDCLLRYTRGVDRLDWELALSAYHPDATDDHGIVTLRGPDFLKFAFPMQRENYPSYVHMIGNVTIELNGPELAHTECYYIFLATMEGPGILGYGRYVDRFEKRNGEWRIADRCTINDCTFSLPLFDNPAEMWAALRSSGPNTRDKTDASYMRPLKVRAPAE